MNRYLKLAVAALVSLTAIGCVSQADYDRLRTALLKEREQNADLQARLEQAAAEIKALREARSGDQDLQARLEAALADKEKLSKALAELEDRLRKLGAMEVMLPPALDAALRDLAAQYPDLLTYDPRKGMVKFAADLTFDLGSDVVKPHAKEALAKFASIMKLPEAARYEAMIVGHTDNVRIARPDTRAKHPTNWHLSVHRAIAVKDVLVQNAVPQDRIFVGGYGEFRPIVPNGPRGAEANRRVELYLVPSTASSVAAISAEPAAPPPAPAKPSAPPAEPPAMFK